MQYIKVMLFINCGIDLSCLFHDEFIWRKDTQTNRRSVTLVGLGPRWNTAAPETRDLDISERFPAPRRVPARLAPFAGPVWDSLGFAAMPFLWSERLFNDTRRWNGKERERERKMSSRGNFRGAEGISRSLSAWKFCLSKSDVTGRGTCGGFVGASGEPAVSYLRALAVAGRTSWAWWSQSARAWVFFVSEAAGDDGDDTRSPLAFGVRRGVALFWLRCKGVFEISWTEGFARGRGFYLWKTLKTGFIFNFEVK